MLDGIRGTVPAAVGVAMVLVVGACGPGSQTDPEAAATTEAVEFAELKQAVADAADTLLDAAAVETGLVTRTADGEVDSIRWSAWVDEHTGKFVELRRTATIAGSGSSGVQITARVVTDNGSADADQSQMDDQPRPWLHRDLPVGPPGWEQRYPDNAAQMASGDVLAAAPSTEPDDIDASVRRSADGSVTWTATWQDEGRTTTYSWMAAPAGHLAEHRREFSISSNGPITERVRYEPLQDAPTITLPAEGTQLDLDRFGVWPDLPWEAAESAAASPSCEKEAADLVTRLLTGLATGDTRAAAATFASGDDFERFSATSSDGHDVVREQSELDDYLDATFSGTGGIHLDDMQWNGTRGDVGNFEYEITVISDTSIAGWTGKGAVHCEKGVLIVWSMAKG